LASLTGLPLNHEAFDLPVASRFLHTGCPQHHGPIIRIIQDSIAFYPPLIINEGQISDLLRRFAKILDDAYAWSREKL